MSLASKAKEIFGSKLFVREKALHDNNCEDGQILYINQFYPDHSGYQPCKYCERIRMAKAKRREAKQIEMAKEGQISQPNETLES